MKLIQDKNDLTIKLFKSNEKAENELQNFLQCTQEKIQQSLELRGQIQRLNDEVHYLEQMEVTLRSALLKAITIPDISEHVDSPQTIEPRLEPRFWDYEFHYADLKYHTFPYDTWIQILSMIHGDVDRVLVSWVTDISDCDNWSFTTADMVSIACKKAGMSHQGAFPVLWSHTHAYNGFVTEEGETYIYEPQNNTVVGKLGETVEPYDTQIVWFPQ